MGRARGYSGRNVGSRRKNLRKCVFGVAAPPDGLLSIPFIAPSGPTGNPSSWGFPRRFPRSSERLASLRPIVISIPWRRGCSEDPRQGGGPGAQMNGAKAMPQRTPPVRKSLFHLLFVTAALSLLSAAVRRERSGLVMSTRDLKEERPGRAQKGCRQCRVRDALLRRRRAVRGRGEHCRPVHRPRRQLGAVGRDDDYDHDRGSSRPGAGRRVRGAGCGCTARFRPGDRSEHAGRRRQTYKRRSTRT